MSAENQSNQSVGRGGKRLGAGRPKGSVDKGNALIREMAVMALGQVGGVEYLARVAESHPGPFLSLLGKILPVQVTGENGAPINIRRIELVPLVNGTDRTPA